jgi:hypothetical protein
MRFLLTYIIIIIGSKVSAQEQNWNWVFGDRAGVRFQNGNTPVPFLSNVATIESSSAVSDLVGNLLFYSGSTGNLPFNNIMVWNHFDGW